MIYILEMYQGDTTTTLYFSCDTLRKEYIVKYVTKLNISYETYESEIISSLD